MAYSATFQWSNTRDQTFWITATDADTGDNIDFSAATAISFVIGDASNCPEFTASLANGKITLPTSTAIQVSVLASDLQAICPRTYKVGMTYEVNATPDDLIDGNTSSVTITDGISRL